MTPHRQRNHHGCSEVEDSPGRYIDCYLVPVPLANAAAYEAMARLAAPILRSLGALCVVESWIDQQGPDKSSYHADSARLANDQYPDFQVVAGARPDETVVLSYVEWPDKATRDAAMAKFASDPRVQFSNGAPVFDGRRLIAGGFIPMRLPLSESTCADGDQAAEPDIPQAS